MDLGRKLDVAKYNNNNWYFNDLLEKILCEQAAEKCFGIAGLWIWGVYWQLGVWSWKLTCIVNYSPLLYSFLLTRQSLPSFLRSCFLLLSYQHHSSQDRMLIKIASCFTHPPQPAGPHYIHQLFFFGTNHLNYLWWIPCTQDWHSKIEEDAKEFCMMNSFNHQNSSHEAFVISYVNSRTSLWMAERVRFILYLKDLQKMSNREGGYHVSFPISRFCD